MPCSVRQGSKAKGSWQLASGLIYFFCHHWFCFKHCEKDVQTWQIWKTQISWLCYGTYSIILFWIKLCHVPVYALNPSSIHLFYVTFHLLSNSPCGGHMKWKLQLYLPMYTMAFFCCILPISSYTGLLIHSFAKKIHNL